MKKECPGTALWPIGATGSTTRTLHGICPKCNTEQPVHLDGGMVLHSIPEPPISKDEILERFLL